eukprot:5816330-Prymnesium_polylepis.1
MVSSEAPVDSAAEVKEVQVTAGPAGVVDRYRTWRGSWPTVGPLSEVSVQPTTLTVTILWCTRSRLRLAMLGRQRQCVYFNVDTPSGGLR